MLNFSNHPSGHQDRLESLKQLLYKYPIVFCGGLWVTLVFLGGLATLGLFNPGSLDPEASQSSSPFTTFVEVTPQQPIHKPTPKKTELPPLEDVTPQQPAIASHPDTTPQSEFPLLLFVTVTLGCAGGSLWLTQVLRASSGRYSTPKRAKPVSTIRKKRRTPSQKPSSSSRTSQSTSSRTSIQTPASNQLATAERRFTQLAKITVLPPEQHHHLDGGKESLAEMMDLRKRYSLASLMRDK
jgi:hypothetical protein